MGGYSLGAVCQRGFLKLRSPCAVLLPQDSLSATTASRYLWVGGVQKAGSHRTADDARLRVRPQNRERLLCKITEGF